LVIAMNRRFAIAFVASVSTLLLSQSVHAQASVSAGAESRKQLFVTVYTTSGYQQTAFIRELREIEVPAGDVSIRLQDIPETVERESILLRVVEGDPIEILEQSYNYNLLSPSAVMRSAEGESATLDIARPNTGELRSIQGRLLTGGGSEAVWQTSEGITFGLGEEKIRLAQVPTRLSSRPTLNWKAKASTAGKRKIELAYLVSGLHWDADYVASLSPDGHTMGLSSWITLTNTTSTTFSNTDLAVAAGTVNRASNYSTVGAFSGVTSASPEFNDLVLRPTREELGDLHLYKLPGQTDLMPHSIKNVHLVTLSGVPVRRRWEGTFHIDPSSHEQTQTNAVTGWIEADNDKKSHAGVPLPRGTVLVMVPDSKGNGQLVATSSCNDTPEDEPFRIRLGYVANVSVKLIPMDYKRESATAREAKYSIEVKNRAQDSGIVRLDLSVGANVSLNVTGATATKVSGNYRIEIPVRPSETKKLQVVANSERIRPSRNSL